MLEAETTAFLEGGCALIVGTVSPDGAPHATRGWGFEVLSATEGRCRLVLDGGDDITRQNLDVGGAIAVTGTSVRTLRSCQLKGTASSVEPATAADVERAGRYSDAFFTDIHETDGTARAILARLPPVSYAACEVIFEELFDQTPGPSAGAPIAPTRP